MFTVRESDIVDNAAVITRRMINEFKCADGWIGIVRYAYFERLLNRAINSGNNISLHGTVFYGVPTPSVTTKAFQGIPHNLVIKTPKYAYQRECRIIGSQPDNGNQRLQMEPIVGQPVRKYAKSSSKQ